MKIEVGKAYRTRGGRKATVSEIIWPGYLRVKHDINGIDYLYHEKYGTVLGSSETHKKYDLISEWTDEPAAVAVNYTSTSESTLAVNAAPDAKIKRYEDALYYLIERADDSNDARYGALSASFVRDVCSKALEGTE